MASQEQTKLDADPEFASLCWKLTEEELALLTESIVSDGCRDPIVYWEIGDRKVIVDGLNRYTICGEHGLPYSVASKEFPDRQAAIRWIIRNQLGRRNVSEVQKSHLRGRLHIERKAERDAEKGADWAANADGCKPKPELGGDTMSPSSPNGGRSDIVSPLKPSPPRLGVPNVAASVAEETGVSTRQIHRDTAFAKAMDRLALKSPTLRDAALAEHIDRGDAVVLADAPLEVLRGIEASPETDRRACVKAAAKAIKDHKVPPSDPRPLVSIKELVELEKAAGALVRAKSKALAACGGETCSWAFKHHEDIREHLNAIFDSTLAWQKDARPR